MASILARITGRDEPAATGHNNPPSDMEILQERLVDSTVKLMGNVDQLLADADKLPESIEDEDQAGEVTDKIKEITGAIKSLESTRVAEKEPYLALTRAVDGYFKVPSAKLETAKLKIKKPLDTFIKKQALIEQQRREDEAKALREEADRQAAAAAAMESSNPLAAGAAMVEATVTEQRAQHVAQSVTAKPAELARSRGISGGLASLRTRWVGQITSRQTLDLNALRPYFTDDSLQKALNAAITAGVRDINGTRIYQDTDTVVR